MHTLKSSSQLKADAREQLLGKYKTVIFAYLIMQFLLSSCLSIAQSQLNLQSLGGSVIYYTVYLIVTLFGAVFTTGQNYMYLNIARGQEFAVRNIWHAFRNLADRCLILQLIILAKMFLCGIPFIAASAALVMTQNYYLSIAVAATLIFFLVTATIISIHYSQVFYLVLDCPTLSARELLAESKSLMKGHKGGYFYLIISFLGVFLLTVLTFGIGTLWVYPYFMSVKANYYLDLTAES